MCDHNKIIGGDKVKREKTMKLQMGSNRLTLSTPLIFHLTIVNHKQLLNEAE